VGVVGDEKVKDTDETAFHDDHKGKKPISTMKFVINSTYDTLASNLIL
jgi:hypothetical protein